MSSRDAPTPDADEVKTSHHDLQIPGEFVYEYAPDVTQVVEYGTSADTVFSGDAPTPPEGIRLDLHLKGPIVGPRLRGTIEGVDYLYVRADGRLDLHVHAQITTDDGENIALTAGGVALRQEGSPVFQLRENVSLITNHPTSSWVNRLQVWASGTVDVSTGRVHIKAYAV